MRTQAPDRVGLGWRGELAAGIFAAIESIDVLEVIAEDWLNAGRRESAALRDLAQTRPVLLHGVSLGLASCERVDPARLTRLARLVEQVRPEAWSEHLAFVRAGGIEIGHLAAPPRTPENIEGSIRNIETARKLLGAAPVLENIATLIDPPGSALGEASWVRSILGTTGTPMLLDLHNLYANALNFGREPRELLMAMPLERVSIVHLSGGEWISREGGRPRLLDDHLHDVPGAVYDLLELLAAAVEQPLTVIVERDGNFPAFEAMLAQVARARGALARGRALAAPARRQAA
jgi:uncharacterized protein (UPF0276 family)